MGKGKSDDVHEVTAHGNLWVLWHPVEDATTVPEDDRQHERFRALSSPFSDDNAVSLQI